LAAGAASVSVRTMYAYVQRLRISSAGTAVQMTSRRVLPWIGGPSRFSSPGRIRKSRTENSTTTTTSTKIGTLATIRTS
jgi:hypothetical protein